jgi:aconitate hydratase 2/2-methylisocitrate dehydratase
VVGTGSSRKSATNSVLWWTGEDIPYVPNKRFGGYCLGGKIAPIFFNTQEDAGALPITDCDVTKMNMGDVIDIYPTRASSKPWRGAELSRFSFKSDVLLDEVQAGGRINLIIGRGLTDWAREVTGPRRPARLPPPGAPQLSSSKGFTLAQKMVGKACGVAGIRPGTYCEPKMTTVGSQDTTGPMTRDELKDLACLGFSADLVMQSFCHTAAYPKPVTCRPTIPCPTSSPAAAAWRCGPATASSTPG